MIRKIKVRRLLYEMESVILNEKYPGLDNYIESEMINRPGLELHGFFTGSVLKRVLVIGGKETDYLEQFSDDVIISKLKELQKLQPPVIILSKDARNEHIIDLFIEVFEKELNVPVIRSSLKTTPLLSGLYSLLHKELSAKKTYHGVLVDINGMGTLIRGVPGIGKSETALELIKNGNILVADDSVEIYQQTIGNLIGSAPAILRRYLEIRGIGIVDVVSMFGSDAYRKYKRIDLIVNLEKWDKNKQYDRIGLDNQVEKIFDTEVPVVSIPVEAGRNISALVESAAANIKLKLMGYSAALNLTQEVARKASGKFKDEDDYED